MPDKKLAILIFALLVFGIIALSFVHSQDEPPMPINPEKIEETREKIETKWDYLSRHWKIMLLQNKIVKTIDSAFTKADEKTKIFRILFGIPWNLGLTTIISILLWFVILFYSTRQFNKGLGFENVYCFLIALALVIILGQAKVFILISNSLFSLFTTTSGKITLVIVFLAVLWVMFFINKMSLESMKARQQNEINNTKQEMTRLRRFSDRFFKWVGKSQ